MLINLLTADTRPAVTPKRGNSDECYRPIHREEGRATIITTTARRKARQKARSTKGMTRSRARIVARFANKRHLPELHVFTGVANSMRKDAMAPKSGRKSEV